MNSFEKKILSLVDRALPFLVLLAASVMGLLLRLPLRDFVSGDSTFFLLPWYEEIRQNGLAVQVGDYNLVYQMLIWLLTKLPLEPLYAYKLVSILFDYLCAGAAALLVCHLSAKDRTWKGIFAYCAVILCPVFFLNSAAWAQCDAIYCAFGLLAIWALAKDRYPLAMIFLGMSFTFKLQAVFLLPVFLLYYFRERKFSILWFSLIPATMLVLALPSLFFGRNPTEIFTIYMKQTETWPYLSLNYPSLWLLLASSGNAQYALLKPITMIFTVGVLAIQMVIWLRRNVPIRGKNLLFMAFLLVFSCILCLPAMHERYGYLYELLSIAIACILPATLPLCLGLMGISLCTYGSYLFKIQIIPLVDLTVLNLAIFVAYLMILNKNLQTDEKPGC